MFLYNRSALGQIPAAKGVASAIGGTECYIYIPNHDEEIQTMHAKIQKSAAKLSGFYDFMENIFLVGNFGKIYYKWTTTFSFHS